MNTEEITKLLVKRCKGTFLGVFAIDRLPRRLPKRRPLMIVCNTDPIRKSGSHWICIYFGKENDGEYFDSFGLHPRTYPIFERYLNKNCSRWIWNSKQIQSVVSHVCGHYVVMYCLFKQLNFSMYTILLCFTEDYGLNDAIAYKYIIEHS